eukprot:7770-Heterococcus_DN1.PRE.3
MKELSLAPERASYTAALTACSTAGQWGRALSVLACMKADGIAPSALDYSAAIDACMKRDWQWERSFA